jgi:hypothetical protein
MSTTTQREPPEACSMPGDTLDARRAWELWERIDTLSTWLWDTYYEQFLDYCDQPPETLPTRPKWLSADLP